MNIWKKRLSYDSLIIKVCSVSLNVINTTNNTKLQNLTR